MKIDASHTPYYPAARTLTHTHTRTLGSLSTSSVHSHAWCCVSRGQRRRKKEKRRSLLITGCIVPAVLLQPTSTAVAVVDWESVQSEVWSNWGEGGSRSVALGVMDRRMIYLRLISGCFLQLSFFFLQALLMVWQKI